MKKTILIIIIGLIGCTGMLDQADPTGPTGDDFFADERDVQLAVVAAYAGLSNNLGLWGRDVYVFEQFSDHHYNGSSDGGDYFQFLYDVEDGLLSDMYQYSYVAVNRSNQVLVNAPLVEGISKENLDNYMGQAYFLRGLIYFFITQVYGDAPIVLEPPTDPAGFTIGASPASDVYDQAISDLEMAEQLLPATQPEAGRVTSLTATALLAKIYLFGADELGNSSWYTLAQQKAEEVINSNVYALFNDISLSREENFKALFSLNNENNSEDIFAVQHFNDGSFWGASNVGNQYVVATSPHQGRSNHMIGWGWAYVYESVLALWDDNDPRKPVSLWYSGEPIVLDGDTLDYYDNGRQNRARVRMNGSAMQKFWWAENFKANVASSDYNIRVLRYADLLLIHAEADFKADGNISGGGLASINAVRNRSGLANLTSGDIDEATILEERRWELFGEGGHRWFDLVRTRTAEQAFAAISANDTDGDDGDKAGFVPQRHYKLPYPQSALDRNTALVQKSAWAGAETN